MKKALLSTLRVICAGAMSLYAVSCYDDSALREDLAGLQSDVTSLAARVDALEKNLNEDVKNVNALAASMEALETSLQAAIQANGAAVQEALEAKLAALEEELSAAVAEGDQALADALAAEKAAIEIAMGALQDGLTSVTGSAEELSAALAALEATLGAKYTEILATMDSADGVLDGKIADLAAGVEAAKKQYADATAALSEELVAEIAKAVAQIAVTNVEVQADKVVLTLASGEPVELSKPVNADNNGLVTIITDESGAKYWAVIVDGEAQSLNIMVGSDVQLEFDIVEGELMFSTNGTDWSSTGAIVADVDTPLFTDFYQGVEWDDYLWEDVYDDYYTLVFGGEDYYLPIYKVDTSVVTIKAGKTYFAFGESITVDVALTDITSCYVMTKPEGWRASLNGKKLTVTAPAKDMVTGGYAEADGEVLLHCTTADGKCKIARLAVATTAGFSLTVAEDGTVTIVNPNVVTSTNMWGEESTDFNDAYVGLAPVAAFEADPAAYVKTIDSNWDDKWIYINNWKMNTAEMDEDWNPIYVIGGAYVPGEYEVDVITRTVPEMYADWTWGGEIPEGEAYVVWACPMDNSGMPNVDELVFGYYFPPVTATIAEVEATTTDVELTVKVSGAGSYYVGLVTEEMTYGFPIDTYMQMQEGPFGYFQMALQYGMADYAFQQMGTFFENENEAISVKASDFNYGMPLLPSTKFYMWVFPVIEGLDLADYTYADNLQPYIYEFSTSGITAGGSLTATFGEAATTYTSIKVPVSAEGASLVYYNFYDVEEYNEIDDVAADLLAYGYVSAEASFEAIANNLAQGTKKMLAAIAVDQDGKYGAMTEEEYASKTLVFSETFVATVGTPEFVANGTNWKVKMNVTANGEIARYYYYWAVSERTEAQQNDLPLAVYPNYMATALPEFWFYSSQSVYNFYVVVESVDGELSKPVHLAVHKPVSVEGETGGVN